jgi:histone H3/H4
MAKAKKKTAKKAPAKKPAKKATKTKSVEMLIVGSKFKDAVRGNDCNVGGDAAEALNNCVHWLIEQATARAVANGRKTVRGHDFT